MKPHSNENVWIPKQNLEIETELQTEILDNFSNRYITGLTQSRALLEARAHSPRLHRYSITQYRNSPCVMMIRRDTCEQHGTGYTA